MISASESMVVGGLPLAGDAASVPASPAVAGVGFSPTAGAAVVGGAVVGAVVAGAGAVVVVAGGMVGVDRAEVDCA